MTAYAAVVLINLAVLALTGFVFWLTRSPWAFLLLLCLHHARSREEEYESTDGA